MDFFGIGLLELFFVVLIALIVLGPKDMVKAGRTIGRFLRRTIFSPTWMNVQSKVRNLPYTLMREAGIEENELDLGVNQFKRETQNPNINDSYTVGDLVSEVKQTTHEVKQLSAVPAEWLTAPSGSEKSSSEQIDDPVPPAEWSTAPSGSEKSSSEQTDDPTPPADPGPGDEELEP